jgi:oxygen-dependent protoporphyrinogen oxidase
MSPLTKPVIAGAFKNLWSGRAAADSIRPDAEAGSLTEADDLSIGQFFSTRINAHTAESLLDPLVAGIWSGDVNRLSIWSCFPALPAAEARSSNHSFVRGLISSPSRPSGAAEATPPKGLHQPPIDDVVARRAMTDGLVGSSFSFRHGLQMLPEALYASLQRYDNVKIRLNAAVSDLSASTSAVQARIGDKVESFDKVFWTTHASALRQSLGTVVTPSLANDLSAFEYASVAIVHVAFNENVLPRELRGFGFLVPSSESKRADLTPEAKLALDGLLGVTFDSVTFPQQNFSREEYERLTNPDMSSMAQRSVGTEQSAEQKLGIDRLSAQLRLTVMMGGARSPHIATLAAADWEARARAVVKHLLRIDAEPDLVRAHCARQGIPQPNVGHIARLNRVHGALNELTHGRIELGGMVNGVSVPDCVMNACRAATSFALQSLPTDNKAQSKTAL